MTCAIAMLQTVLSAKCKLLAHEVGAACMRCYLRSCSMHVMYADKLFLAWDFHEKVLPCMNSSCNCLHAKLHVHFCD